MSFKVTLLVYCMTARMMTATLRFITLVGKFYKYSHVMMMLYNNNKNVAQKVKSSQVFI